MKIKKVESIIEKFSKSPLNNGASYLRFIARYSHEKAALPIIQFINPKQSNTPILLNFK